MMMMMMMMMMCDDDDDEDDADDVVEIAFQKRWLWYSDRDNDSALPFISSDRHSILRPFQAKFFEIMEYVAFNLNFVPCKELISLSILIKANQWVIVVRMHQLDLAVCVRVHRNHNHRQLRGLHWSIMAIITLIYAPNWSSSSPSSSSSPHSSQKHRHHHHHHHHHHHTVLSRATSYAWRPCSACCTTTRPTRTCSGTSASSKW